jgi:hypothetical protein
MSFFNFLSALMGRKPQPPNPAPPAPPSNPSALRPDSPDEPAQITSPRVLLIIYNPTMDAAAGTRLAAFMGWSRPDDLVSSFISDVLQSSGGLVRYSIAHREELDEFPALADGFRYTPDTYLGVARNGVPAHVPPDIDYNAILTRFNILARIDNHEFDEVWVMGFPYAGLHESVMAGAAAFWCNAAPLPNTAACSRRFVIMGFSYERQVGEMLHSYNHRCEAILAKLFNSLDFLVWAYKLGRAPATLDSGKALNLFQRYILFDQIAPGKAAIGLVHYAPNGVRDYDLGNPNPVPSDCYDWLSFPNFHGDVRMVSAAEWGGGSERGFQEWWLRHLPKTAGRQNGIHNNWWQYIANLDNVIG